MGEPAGRQPIYATSGMVCSPHALASLHGLRVLQAGGNAVDAAVATNAVLTVVYPHMCSIGGDAFWLIYTAADRRLHALNGGGEAPRAATLDWFHDHGITEMPLRGILPVIVPGAVDAWAQALDAYGTRPFDALLVPAIEYAGDGFPVSPKLAAWIGASAEVLRANPAATRVFLPNGCPPGPGERLVQADLARTLRQLAADGPRALYEGALAAEIATEARRQGGLLTDADLAAYHSRWVAPVSSTYRDSTIYEFGPPTQGPIALEVLNILEGWEPGRADAALAVDIHLAVEAVKLAYADRRHITDPRYADVPVERLISKDYAATQRGRIDPRRARAAAHAPSSVVGDTVYLCVVDRWGNAVSLIQSICMVFGSGVVLDGTGILLQNRGMYFSLNPADANHIAPGKQTFHTLTPAMAFRGGEPWLVFGTMGGEGQSQTHVQVLSNVVERGYDVQTAIDAPRWLAGRFFLGDDPDVLNIETRVPSSVLSQLQERGHSVRGLGDWAESVGHAQAIEIDRERGVLIGAADSRGDGAAAGW